MRFTSPPRQQDFNEKVWEQVKKVPQGKVVTYGQIAQMIPLPEGMDFQYYKAFAPRWVGGAMAACPEDVPWHRVINSQGKISAKSEAQRQRQLLAEEGIVFVNDRVNLRVYQWNR